MRLIDVEELLNKITELESVALEQVAKSGPLADMHPGDWYMWTGILQERTAFKFDLMDAPTVDAVPVVRCKDCKHKYNDGNQIICQRLYWCDGTNFEPSAEDFCSRGERREDERK